LAAIAGGSPLCYAIALVLLCACNRDRLQVRHNPYAHVDWKTVHAWKAQMHEHVRDDMTLLKQMDAAGYDIVPLMHYSGVEGHGGAWHERHWPPERYLPAGFAAEFKHIKLFYPNAEEVGYEHVTSPMLTTYIERRPKGDAQVKPFHYASTQQAIDLIAQHGGLPFIAHPWSKPQHYTSLHAYTGMELYNAYCRHKFQVKERKRDCNEALLRSWDTVLAKDPSIVGIAVNDWFGPGTIVAGTAPDTLDSGKIVMLMQHATLDEFRNALKSGALFAIKDLGAIKDRFPRIRSIAVDDDSIRIVLGKPGGEVHWIVDGQTRSSGPVLKLGNLPKTARYARAEVRNADGSTTYTQAFALGVTVM
jgi:hypothetical protein